MIQHYGVCVFLGEGAGEGGVSVARSPETRTIFSESLKPRVFVLFRGLPSPVSQLPAQGITETPQHPGWPDGSCEGLIQARH